MPITGLEHIKHFVKSSSESRAAFSHLCLAYASKNVLDICYLTETGILESADRYKFPIIHNSSLELSNAKKQVLGVESEFNTLVPEEIFDVESSSLFLTSQLSEVPTSMVILNFHIPELRCYLVSGFDAHVIDKSKQLLPKATLTDASIGLLIHWKLLAKKLNQPLIFIAWTENKLEFSAWQNGNLNTYSKQSIQNAEDIVYLTFYLLEQLPSNFQEAELLFSGSHSDQTQIIEKLQQYHQNCVEDTSILSSYLSETGKRSKSIEFTQLVSLTLCV